MIFEDGERLVLAEGFPGPVSFEWSPDGTKVAYLDEQRARLTVADARTGEAINCPARRVRVLLGAGQHAWPI